VIGTLIASSAAAIAVRGTRPANVIFICLTVMAAGVAGYAALRMLWPLAQPDSLDTPEMLGGRTRAALEREKTLALRAIKELEFDRAMGKVSEADWQEMTGRLRTRALRVMRQLDSGSAAYREVIERELAARQATVGKRARHVVAVLVVGGSLLVGSAVQAQMGGMGGVAGMPDAKAMSGIPRPSETVPAGAVSVRLVRGVLSNLIIDHSVDFTVNGKKQTVKSDQTGHALLTGLAPGTTVQAVTTVDGERLESQEFQIPPQGGVVLMLVAADKSAELQIAREAVPGSVSLGGQSRVILQFEDEVLQVYYLFDLVNKNPGAPVKTASPVVFDLPAGAQNTTVLEGSSPLAKANGPHVTVTGPFRPGVTSVQIAYSLQPSARVAIRQPLPVAFDQVTLIAERTGAMTLSSPQLTNVREVTDTGKPTLIGMGPALKAGDVLALDLAGLPHHPTWPRNVALTLAALLVAGGAWGALRTRGRSAEAAVRQQLETRRERVFRDLLALEEKHTAGPGSDEAFAVRRDELVGELERIYGELDTEPTGPRGDQGLAA
jgi:hypothetical protein